MLFNLFGSKKSIENPANQLTPKLILEGRGGIYGLTHINTSIDEALSCTFVVACERAIAETIASLPLIVYQRAGNSKERATTHPLYDLLHNRPNEFQTPVNFWQSVIYTAINTGNAYIHVERDMADRVASLLLLESSKVKVVISNGTKAFSYDSKYILPNSNVLHITGLSTDGLTGIPLSKYAGRAIAMALMMEEYGFKFFKQGETAGGHLEFPSNLTKEQIDQLDKTWGNKSGIDEAHKTKIVPWGGKYVSNDVPNDKAQFLESRKFQLNEIARCFRIPPHLVGDLDRGTFSNIEHQSIEFIQNAIQPWLDQITQEINLKLFSSLERQIYFAEYLVDARQKGDITTRYAAYNTGKQGGWLSTNDIRRAENLPEIEGGDEYLSPLNMRPTGGEAGESNE